MESKQEKGLNISARSFLTAIIVIFILMVAAYLLTFLLPGGVYARIPDENGNLIIDTAAGFTHTQGGIPFWKWLLSPILVLGGAGNGTLIAVIAFLLVIGGIFNSLDKCGLMKYILNKTVSRFSHVRYRLMAIILLFFMALGSMIGSFEECVPLVPIVVALSISLGWDALTGIGMSVLAAGCGFAAGVCNPFTVGVAQELAGLPMFSGVWLRLVSFVLIYGLLFAFLLYHAKKVEKPLHTVQSAISFVPDGKMDKGMMSFGCILGVGILAILCSPFVPVLQDLTMVIVAVMFLAAGIVSTLLSGMPAKELGKTAWSGVVSIFPAVIMLLMASSI